MSTTTANGYISVNGSEIIYVGSMISATQTKCSTVWGFGNGGKSLIISASDTGRTVNGHPNAQIMVGSTDIRPVQQISLRQANMVAFPAGTKVRVYGR